jgi:hypothetical protein
MRESAKDGAANAKHSSAVPIVATARSALSLERRALEWDRDAVLSLCLRIGFIRKPMRTFRSDMLDRLKSAIPPEGSSP